MTLKIDTMLEELNIGFIWADERDRGRHWSSVSDVACSRMKRFVSVPRRRRNAYHFAEVVHEVAHLLTWTETGKSPARHDEVKVCERAIRLAEEHGLSEATIEWLRKDLEKEKP